MGIATAALIAGAMLLGSSVPSYLTAHDGVAHDGVAAISPPKASGRLSFFDHKGRTVDNRVIQGKFLLVYFGYTSCPDVCPMDLAVIGRAIDALGRNTNKVVPVFITVDPKRDTVEVMAKYLKNFHPRFLGLSGLPRQIAEAADAFGVNFTKMYVSGESQYTVNHTALSYLMAPDGRKRLLFRQGTTAKIMTASIRKVLEKASASKGRK